MELQEFIDEIYRPDVAALKESVSNIETAMTQKDGFSDRLKAIEVKVGGIVWIGGTALVVGAPMLWDWMKHAFRW